MNNKKQYSKTNSSTHVLFEHVGEKSLKQANNDFISREDVCDDLINNKKSIMVTDTSGVLFNTTARARAQMGNVYLLNLSNTDIPESTTINPLMDLLPGFTSSSQAKMLANSLIELPKAPNIDDHWALTGREWVMGMILYIYYFEKPENRHLAHLYSMLMKGGHSAIHDAQGFGELMEDCPDLEAAQYTTDNQAELQKELDYIQERIRESGHAIACMNDREAASVISTMTRNLSCFRDPWIEKAIKKNAFSLWRFAESESTQTLYIHAPGGNELNSSFIRATFRLMRNLLDICENKRQTEGLALETLGSAIKISN